MRKVTLQVDSRYELLMCRLRHSAHWSHATLAAISVGYREQSGKDIEDEAAVCADDRPDWFNARCAIVHLLSHVENSVQGLPESSGENATKQMESILPTIRKVNEQFQNPGAHVQVCSGGNVD